MSSHRSQKAVFHRLPTSVVPLNYQIRIKPNLIKFTFEGWEKILLQITQSTDRIVLNARDIRISNYNLVITSKANNKTLNVKEIEYKDCDEVVILGFGECLALGEAELSMSFTGVINDKLLGFYRTKYTGPDGVLRNAAVTQFEATSARYAFPCWDEPARKASFDITLVVPKDPRIQALSNMPVVSEEVEGDFRVVKFDRTPLMSTYLVAYAVGEFDYVETKSKSGILIRVYAPVGKKEQGLFALDVAAKCLDFYTDYYKIAYPLGKVDLIAVPDFASGAMENWGLITYRENFLLVDPRNTSTAQKQSVALTVAHELSHQWFGNLVTMEWWTDLWLNEGFATFMEYFCVNYLLPVYNIWTQFVSDTLIQALNLDGLRNSHPIEVPVMNPSEIDEIFDDISYSKGASVIRMLNHYIGDETFQMGLSMYLKKFSYKNARTEDLWTSMEETSHKPIRRVMAAWTKQKGFPYIDVKVRYENGNALLTLTQEKFSLTGVLWEEEKKLLWPVPISIITCSSPDKPVIETLLEERSMELKLEGLGPNDWFKLNPSKMGVYRVQYQPEQMANFTNAMDKLNPLDRLDLLVDTNSLVVAGSQPVTVLFTLLNSFRFEVEYNVWCAVCKILSKFYQLLAHTPFYGKLVKFGQNMLNESIFPKIGWQPKENEPYLDTLLRAVLIEKLVLFEDKKILAECRKRFDDFVVNQKEIPADLRTAVYSGVAIECDDKTFDKMIELHNKADQYEEKERIIIALGYSKNVRHLAKLLEFSKTDNIRAQDTGTVLETVSSNPLGRDLCWKFFRQNCNKYRKQYGTGSIMAQMVYDTTSYFTTMEKANEVEEFFRKNPVPGAERTIQQCLETIRLEAKILKRDYNAMRDFFEKSQDDAIHSYLVAAGLEDTEQAM